MTTTSPWERDFSHLLLAFQKRAASPLLKEIQLRIHSMLQSEPGLKDEVIRRAREIWSHGFFCLSAKVVRCEAETLSLGSSSGARDRPLVVNVIPSQVSDAG